MPPGQTAERNNLGEIRDRMTRLAERSAGDAGGSGAARVHAAFLPAPRRRADRGRAARPAPAALLRGRPACRAARRGARAGDHRLLLDQDRREGAAQPPVRRGSPGVRQPGDGRLLGKLSAGIVAQPVDPAGHRGRHDRRRFARRRPAGLQRRDALVPARRAALAAQRARAFRCACGRTSPPTSCTRPRSPSCRAAPIRSCSPTRR